MVSASVNVPVPFSATVFVAGVLARLSTGGTVTIAEAFGGVGHCAGVPQPPLFADTVFVYGEPTPEVTV